MQKSFFKANVIDIELLLDNAILALSYQIAAKEKVKWILSGLNSATEGMRMPKNWNWMKYDAHNIKDIQSKFGSLKIKTHPLISVKQFLYYRYFKRIELVPFLNYFDYDKEKATAVLENEVGYKRYANKHYESIFTRFYQAYILPKKFGVDKRKLHLSTMIISGLITREEGERLLREQPYASEKDMRLDYEYVLKKLGFLVKWNLKII